MKNKAAIRKQTSTEKKIKNGKKNRDKDTLFYN